MPEPSLSEKLREKEKEVRKEVKKQTIGYIVTALGLVAGLAWNEAIQSLVSELFPGNNGSILIKFLYAIVVTVLIVIVTLYLLKLQKRESDE